MQRGGTQPLREPPPRGSAQSKGQQQQSGGAYTSSSSSSTTAGVARRSTAPTATDIYGRPQVRRSKTTLQAPSDRTYAPRPKHQHDMVLPETSSGVADGRMMKDKPGGENFFAPRQQQQPPPPAPSTAKVVTQPHTGPLDGRHLELLERMRERRDFQEAQRTSQQPERQKLNHHGQVGARHGSLVIPNAVTAEELSSSSPSVPTIAASPSVTKKGNEDDPSPQQGRKGAATGTGKSTTGGGGGSSAGIEAFWKEIKTEDDFMTTNNVKKTQISKLKDSLPSTPPLQKQAKREQQEEESPSKPESDAKKIQQFKAGKGHCFVSMIEKCFDPLRLSTGGVVSDVSRRLLSTALIPLKASSASTTASPSSNLPPTLVPWVGTIEDLSQHLLSDLWKLVHETCIYLAAFDPSNPMPWTNNSSTAEEDEGENERGGGSLPGGGQRQDGRRSGGGLSPGGGTTTTSSSPGGRGSGHTEELGGEVAPNATSFTAIAKKMGQARSTSRTSGNTKHHGWNDPSNSETEKQSYLTAVEWSFVTKTATELRYRRAAFFSTTPVKRTVSAMVELAVSAGLSPAEQESLVMAACSAEEMDLAVEGMVQDVHELLIFLLWVSCKYNFPALAEHFEFQRLLKKTLITPSQERDGLSAPPGESDRAAIMDKFLIPAEFASDLEFEATTGKGYLSSIEWPPIGFPLQRRLNDRVDMLGRNLGLHQLLLSSSSSSPAAVDEEEGENEHMDDDHETTKPPLYPTDMRSPPRLRRELLRLVSNPDALGFDEVSHHSTSPPPRNNDYDYDASAAPPPPPLSDRFIMIQRQLSLALKRLDVSWKKLLCLTHRGGLQGRYTVNDILMAGGCLPGPADGNNNKQGDEETNHHQKKKKQSNCPYDDDQFETCILLLEYRAGIPGRLQQLVNYRKECLQILTQRMRALEGPQKKRKGAPSVSLLQQYNLPDTTDAEPDVERQRSTDCDPIQQFQVEVEEFWREVKAATASSTAGTIPGSRQAQLRAQGSSSYLEREEKRFAKEHPEEADEVVHSVGHVSFYELSLQSCLSRELLHSFFLQNPLSRRKKQNSNPDSSGGLPGEEEEEDDEQGQTAFLSDEERDKLAQKEKVLDPVLYDAQNILQFPGSIQDAITRCYDAAVRAQETVMAAEETGELTTSEHLPLISEEEVRSIFLRHPGSVQCSCVGPKSGLPPGTTVSAELVSKNLKAAFQRESLALLQLREEEAEEIERTKKFGGGSGQMTLDHLGLREVGCARSNEGEVPAPASSLPNDHADSAIPPPSYRTASSPTAGGGVVGTPGSPVYI